MKELLQSRNISTPQIQWTYRYLLPLLSISIVILIYSNSFSAPFIFDDSETISRNMTSIRSLADLMTTRGLADLTFRINIMLTGNRVADFRLVNILIHCLAGLFLYLLIRVTLQMEKLQKLLPYPAEWTAGIISILWMLHPVQTESVTYISQRYESLMGLFFLICLYCFAKGITSPRRRFWFNACLISCLSGMMCKEVMATAPVVILLYDWTFSGENIREVIQKRGKFYIALFLLYPVFILLWTSQIVQCLKKGIPITGSTEPWTYLLSQFTVLTHYIKIIFLPLNLCLDYAWEPPSSLNEVILPAIFILILILSSLSCLVKRNPYGFLGTSFFIILAPTSSLIPVEDLAFEHRLYLPLATVIVSVVSASLIVSSYLSKYNLHLRRIYHGWLVILSVICIASFSYLTIKRNATYNNEELLWQSVVKLRPGNLRARNNLAAVLCEKKKYDEALPHLLYVLQQTEGKFTCMKERKPLMPLSPSAHRFNALVNLGTMMFHTGKFQDAIKYYTEALQIFPYSDIVHAKLYEATRCLKNNSEPLPSHKK